MPQMQDEATWRLLLSELWQKPDTGVDIGVICKLLCCSKSMEELVHNACAGQLVLHSGLLRNRQKCNITADSNSWTHEIVLCRWLAKHARLVSNLHILPAWSRQGGSYQPTLKEYVLAAGFAAAPAPAGQQSASDRPRTRRAAATAATAEATAISAACEAAAAGPSSRLYQQQQQQGLPLQSLTYDLPSDGRMLCSLSGSTHLTQLKLGLCKGAQPAAGCRHALASLTGLKELGLTVGYAFDEDRFHVPSDLGVFTYLAPAFRQLTRLTSLCVPGFSSKPQQLPSSLLELRTARPAGAGRINWQSLEGVTCLLLNSGATTDANLQVTDVLPPNLQQLQLCLSGRQHGPPSLLPVLQLPHLTKLVLQMEYDVFPAEVQLLQGMSQLKVLEVSCSYIKDQHAWSKLGQVLSAEALPLQAFSVLCSGCPAGAIKPWKHLTSLSMLRVDLQHQQEIRQLAEQLRHLPALCTLHMRGVTAPLYWADANADFFDYEPLLQAIAECPCLRELHLDGMPLRDAVACLSAATQLRQLCVLNAPMSAEVAAALRAALAPHGATVVLCWCP